MVYSFELIKHANIRYRESLPSLACCELFAMLYALGINADIRIEKLGHARFMTFECRTLSDQELAVLSGHSAVVFMAENRDGLLKPISVADDPYFPDDLPEVLKYKGKTGVTFTRMMINVSIALSAFRNCERTLTFYDPLCGRGTGCFCALAAGLNAVGLDVDRKDVREASDYFSRYLQFHKLKHDMSTFSETVSNHAVPVTRFQFAPDRERYQSGDIHWLKLAVADTADSPALFRKEKAHIMAADLPYGIQHAPQAGSRPEPLHHFLVRVLPAWKQALYPGGVLAVSFNTLTFPAAKVRESLLLAGFTLPSDDLFTHLEHDVEHAVVRDVVFALNAEEESVK